MLAALLGVFSTPGAMAQGPEPDATSGQATDAEPVPPLKWLRYSSERFRTLMRMLAVRAARSEAKRATEAKAAEEAKRAAEAKAAEEARRAAEAKRAADAKAAEEARRVAEAKAAEEARRAAEAKRAADAKVAEEARLAADPKAAPPAAPPGKSAACPNAGVKVAGAGWYVVESGDSLWSIARAHYGYGRTYRRIYAANRRSIANPRLIYPCQRIYIPRAGRGEAPLQLLRVALEPFISRRAIDTALPGFID